MNKFIKPEIEIIKFNCEDVIATSGGDTYNMLTNQYSDTDAFAKNTQNYGDLGWNTQY